MSWFSSPSQCLSPLVSFHIPSQHRLDAVEDIMDAPAFLKAFDEECKRMPDLERLLSRIHAGSCRIKDL